MTIYDFLNENYAIDKPIRLIELFGGYGSQNLALKYLLGKSCHYKLCEWAIKSIQAYNDLHIRDYTDYSIDLSKDEVLDELVRLGVSSDYNKCATRQQLARTDYRKIYNNIKATNNLVDISKTHAKDLEIVEQNKYTYMLTYSFPCQDLSLAGNCKGMAKGNGTRSGLLWEVERILFECKELNCLPEILIMENVPQVHSKRNQTDFQAWLKSLEKLGYSNYWQDLNAKNYGIPQNRNRTFMVSILGNYKYEFPKTIELHLKLKDMLEDEVDDKYYLSQKMVNCFMSDGTSNYPRRERFLQNINRENQDVGNAITTLAGQRPTDNFVLDDKLFLSEKMINYIAADNEKYTGNNDKSLVNKTIASTINTKEGTRRCDASNYIAYGMPENTDLKQVIYGNKRLNETLEKNEIKDGDFVDAYNKIKNSNICGTITTRVAASNCSFVVNSITTSFNPNYVLPIKNATKQGYLLAEEGDGVDISSRMQYHRGTVQKQSVQTIQTSPSLGVIVKVGNYSPSNHNGTNILDTSGVSQTVMENHGSVQTVSDSRLGIRKLAPKECFRLQGLKDEDIDNIMVNQSNASCYHLAGDSICVSVLISIFGKLFGFNDNEIERKIREVYENDRFSSSKRQSSV
jgi:DNA-cytosine methyltransferase